VSRVVEQPDIGALQELAKILHGGIHTPLVEIELRAATDQPETKPPQGLGDQRGVVAWIAQRSDMLIGRIADDERDTLLRQRRR
jgi:hypothetical protein